MEDVQAIILHVVIFLAIAQLSYTAPQDAGNILKKRESSSHLTEEERNNAINHSIEKRNSQVFAIPPMFVQNCNQIYNLDIGDSAVFFSEDGIERRRCRYRFKSPKDTKINIECPIFNLNREGCKMESFTINERGKKKETFCKRNKPPVDTGTSNRITVAYRRNKQKKIFKNRGYICRAFVIREYPTTTAPSSTSSPSTISTWDTEYPTTFGSTTVLSTSSSSTNPTIPTTFNPWFPTPSTSSGNGSISATTLLFTLFPVVG